MNEITTNVNGMLIVMNPQRYITPLCSTTEPISLLYPIVLVLVFSSFLLHWSIFVSSSQDKPTLPGQLHKADIKPSLCKQKKVNRT